MPHKMRDAVCLRRLRLRPDLNGCYGLVQTKRAADVYEVRVGMENVCVSMDNLVFVADRMPPTFLPEQTDPIGDVDLRKVGLVLDRPLQLKYAPGDVLDIAPRDVRALARRSREPAVWA